MTLVTVPNSQAYVNCSDCIEAKGIKVTSQKPVVVYSHIYYQYRSDATLVLPTKTTGKEYYCIANEQKINTDRTQFMICGQKDDTKVRITPTVDLLASSGGRLSAGSSYTITLDEGEVYQGRAYSSSTDTDISGTHIEVIDTGASANCRTISVFSGSSWTSLGCSGGFNSGDNLYEQMYPVNSWGSRFVVVPLSGVNSFNMRLMAAEDATTVIMYNVAGTPTQFYLAKAGDYDDAFNVDEVKYLLANKPIMVAQYSKTQSCSGGDSDPSMTIINPLEQTLDKITVYSSRYEDIDDHYINIVIPTSAVNSFRIDGNKASFSVVSRLKRYSYAQIKVSQGNHQLSADQGFIATAYGFGRFESYGYAAGASVKDLTAKIDLSNSSLADENNICLGSSADFEGSAEYVVTKWEWDFGDGKGANTQKASHVYKDTGTYTVKLYTYKKVFDGCSVYDSSIMHVKVTGKPKAKFVSSLKCEKSTVNFTDSSEAPFGETIFSTIWRFHSGNDQFGPTAKKYYDTSGKFYMRQIIRTEFQCYDTIEDSIIINPKPIAFFEISESCQRDSTEFTNLSTITSGSIVRTYWDFGDGDTSLLYSPKHFYQDSGQHEVLLSLMSDSMCTSQFIDTAYKYAYIDLSFEFQDTCKGLTIDFNNTSTNHGATLTKMGWNVSDGDSSKFYSWSKTFDTSGTFDVQFWVEVDSVCRDTLTKQIVVYPLVDGSFKVDGACANDSTKFVNTSSIPWGTVSVVSWDVDDGNTYTADSFKIKYPTDGAKDITLKLVSDKGCAETVQKQINVKDLDVTGLDFKDVCLGVTQDINATRSGSGDPITSWSWVYESNVVSFDTFMIFKPTTAGKHGILLGVKSKGGCFQEFTDTVTVFDKPVSAFTVDPVCLNEDFILNNTSYGQNGDIVSSQTWNYNGSFLSSNVAPAQKATPVGQNTFELIVESNRGCLDTSSVSVEVYPIPNVNFSFANTCVGQQTTITQNSSISSGSMSVFRWNFHDASSKTGNSTTFDYPFTGVYPVQLIVGSNQGCIDSITKNIEIYPSPVLDIELIEGEGCVPFTPVFTNNSTIESGSIDRFDWTWGDGSSSSGTLPSHTYTLPGNYKVKIKATSDRGCVDSFNMATDVVVHALPIADFSFTPENPSLLESTVDFMDLSIGNITNWDWQMGEGTTYDVQNPIHNYTDIGTFEIILTVTDDNGCQATATNTLYIDPDLFVYFPTSFSPNGDLLNDKFGLGGIKEGVKNFTMAIYNRWGEKMYETDDVTKSWDGTYKGVQQEMGSYFYTIQFTDFKVTRWYYHKGEVLLLR